MRARGGVRTGSDTNPLKLAIFGVLSTRLFAVRGTRVCPCARETPAAFTFAAFTDACMPLSVRAIATRRSICS
eukprot:5584830-Pleurochrysis_carterae.AAC.1